LNDTIVVWIVEDMQFHAAQAWEVVAQVGREYGEAVERYWAIDTSWGEGPALRRSVNLAQAADAHLAYPDLVILDLMFGTENAESFLGKAFYERLRSWEAHKPGKPAFVVLWSIHQGALATEAFVNRTLAADPRVIPLGTKRPELLKDKLRQLWRRMMEERQDGMQ
jgi:hypothetical protein